MKILLLPLFGQPHSFYSELPSSKLAATVPFTATQMGPVHFQLELFNFESSTSADGETSLTLPMSEDQFAKPLHKFT
jgi:hypothetical protein